MKRFLLAVAVCSIGFLNTHAQNEKMKAEDTEFYTPVPPVVTPGKSFR
jgi:hypothetical protein